MVASTSRCGSLTAPTSPRSCAQRARSSRREPPPSAGRSRRRSTLRTHEGEQQLRQGDVVAFPRGKEGAHQIRNDTDAPVRVLMLSTLIAPEIVEYLDTGKIGARSVAPNAFALGIDRGTQTMVLHQLVAKGGD